MSQKENLIFPPKPSSANTSMMSSTGPLNPTGATTAARRRSLGAGRTRSKPAYQNPGSDALGQTGMSGAGGDYRGGENEGGEMLSHDALVEQREVEKQKLRLACKMEIVDFYSNCQDAMLLMSCGIHWANFGCVSLENEKKSDTGIFPCVREWKR